MVQSITIASGPAIQMAVETGGLDIPALIRHAAIQGSIVDFSNQSQSSQGQMLSCDVAAAAVERATEASVGEILTCRALTEAAGRT